MQRRAWHGWHALLFAQRTSAWAGPRPAAKRCRWAWTGLLQAKRSSSRPGFIQLALQLRLRLCRQAGVCKASSPCAASALMLAAQHRAASACSPSLQPCMPAASPLLRCCPLPSFPSGPPLLPPYWAGKLRATELSSPASRQYSTGRCHSVSDSSSSNRQAVHPSQLSSGLG